MITKNFTRYCSFDFLDKNHACILKGIAIFIVMLVHLLNRFTDIGIFSPIAGGGVAVFLFCSGFGLSESSKKNVALSGYWKNKFVKIYLPVLTVIIFSAIFNNIGLKAFICEATFFKGFENGWYLQFLFVQYLLFYLIWKFVKNDKIRIAILLLVSVPIVFFPIQIYAEQALSFFLGVMVSHYNLQNKISKNKITINLGIGIIVLGIGISTWLLRHKTEQFMVLNNLVWLLFKLSLAISIIILTFCFRKLGFGILFYPIGVISYALYLIHGQFYFILENANIVNLIIYFIVVISTSIGLTYLSKLYTRLINNKRKAKIK